MTKAIMISLLLVTVGAGCSSTSPHADGPAQDASYAPATPDRFAAGKFPLVKLTFGAEAGTYPDKLNPTKDTIHVCHATISDILADVVGEVSVGQQVLVVCSVDKTSTGYSDFTVGPTPPPNGDEETVLLLAPPMTDVMGDQRVYGIYPANTDGPGAAARTTPSPFAETLDVDPKTYAQDLTTTSLAPTGQ